MFCSSKDFVQFQQKANVVYKITWPGCFNKYIGKTDKYTIARIDEHGTEPNQAVHHTPYKLYKIWRIYLISYTSWYRYN